jgi:hypothetical protein
VAGSALAAANHYLGRVARVEWVSSEVRLLEDPGSSVLVLADFGGGEAPLHLGLMHTQSFDRSRHELELRWQPSVESLRQVALRRERSVRLFTGSGDRLVPPGLLIGESEVSATRADQVLRVRRAPWLLECLAVEVWQPQAAETDS